MLDYEAISEKFDEPFKNLLNIAPTYQSVNDIENEEDEAAFVQGF